MRPSDLQANYLGEIILWHNQGKSYQEIADLFGSMGVMTSERTVYRIIQTLDQSLNKTWLLLIDVEGCYDIVTGVLVDA